MIFDDQLVKPSIGFGVYNRKKRKNMQEILLQAQKVGFKLFDTANAYGTSEIIIGRIINRSSFIITKISNVQQRSGDIKTAFKGSLQRTKSIDLYMIHWPVKGYYQETWKQMERLKDTGQVKYLGVSNFRIVHLNTLMSTSRILPFVNEIECHPLNTQKEQIEYNRKNGIKIITHTPLGRMNKLILNNKTLQELSDKYKKTIAQIVLRWHIQQDRIPIPHTSNVSRVAGYMDVFDFCMTPKELESIDGINQDKWLGFVPSKSIYWRI